MKVILSRKGFDSGYGGYPSPILPDGRLISLPIPDDDKIKYSDLKFDNNQSYFDLMKGLNPAIKSHKNSSNECHELTKDTECHLDPDIYSNILKRSKDWKSCFGQISSSQTHLKKQGVKEGDLFIFFGWFRKTEYYERKLRFVSSDLHVIFGYLQIGEILPVDDKTDIPDWMKLHPHVTSEYRRNPPTNNTIYVARDNLTWDSKISGAGVFKFSKELVLTKEGFKQRTKWALPEFFKNVRISYHSKNSWKPEGYFQSVKTGQEIVIEDNTNVENWAKQIINNNI